MTEWLADAEQQAWRGLLVLNGRLQARLNRDLQDRHGISLADYEVLVRLHDRAEGWRVRELGPSLNWEQSRLSHQLTRMERRGLIERRDCVTDRRGAMIAITDAGRAAVETAAPDHVTAVRRLLFDALSPEDVSHLADLTARANAHLDGPRGSTGPGCA